jgi:hypothetical protein
MRIALRRDVLIGSRVYLNAKIVRRTRTVASRGRETDRAGHADILTAGAQWKANFTGHSQWYGADHIRKTGDILMLLCITVLIEDRASGPKGLSGFQAPTKQTNSVALTPQANYTD